MTNAAIYINGQKLPINPPELRYRLPSDNRRYTLLGIGEVNVLRDAKLAEVSFEGVLPPHAIPGVNNGALQPAEYIAQWQALMEAKTPVGFVYVGEGWSVVMSASIEGLDYREKGGAVGWIEYAMTILKWTSYAVSGAAEAQPAGAAAGLPRTETAPPASETQAAGAAAVKRAASVKQAAAKKQSAARTQGLTIGGDRAQRGIYADMGLPGYSLPVF